MKSIFWLFEINTGGGVMMVWWNFWILKLSRSRVSTCKVYLNFPLILKFNGKSIWEEEQTSHGAMAGCNDPILVGFVSTLRIRASMVRHLHALLATYLVGAVLLRTLKVVNHGFERSREGYHTCLDLRLVWNRCVQLTSIDVLIILGQYGLHDRTSLLGV